MHLFYARRKYAVKYNVAVNYDVQMMMCHERPIMAHISLSTGFQTSSNKTGRLKILSQEISLHRNHTCTTPAWLHEPLIFLLIITFPSAKHARLVVVNCAPSFSAEMITTLFRAQPWNLAFQHSVNKWTSSSSSFICLLLVYLEVIMSFSALHINTNNHNNIMIGKPICTILYVHTRNVPVYLRNAFIFEILTWQSHNTHLSPRSVEQMRSSSIIILPQLVSSVSSRWSSSVRNFLPF